MNQAWAVELSRCLGAAQVVHVASPSRPPVYNPAKRSKVELIKEKSDYLRHPLMEQLVNENNSITEEAM